VSYYFVDDVRLGSVVGVLDVAEVLRGAEDLEGEGVEELALAEDSVGGLDAEAGLGLEVGGELA
jgi:hypothetical protein